jgi:hypothetical protein
MPGIEPHGCFRTRLAAKVIPSQWRQFEGNLRGDVGPALDALRVRDDVEVEIEVGVRS